MAVPYSEKEARKHASELRKALGAVIAPYYQQEIKEQ